MSTITYCEILSTRRSTHTLSLRGSGRGKREERSQLVSAARMHTSCERARFSAHKKWRTARSRFTLSFACRSIHLAKKRTESVTLSFWNTFSNHPLARKWLRKEKSFVVTLSAKNDIMLLRVKNKQISPSKCFGGCEKSCKFYNGAETETDEKYLWLVLSFTRKKGSLCHSLFNVGASAFSLYRPSLSLRIMKY